MNCYRLLLTAVFCGLIHGAVVAQDVPIYKDPKAPVDARVEDLFKRLTPDEKLSLLQGNDFFKGKVTQAFPRLGVPAMWMTDGGQGVNG